ncbi:hypothetical protein C1Y08_30590, partial [Pseudomonas sp. FW306-02-F02-AA]
RRAMAARPHGTHLCRFLTAATLDAGLADGLQLLGQMSGPNNVDVFRWPPGTSSRDRATVGGRDKLLGALASCDDPRVWTAATADPWTQD